MVGQKDIDGARRGEIFFARTSVVRWRVAGAPPQCVGDCASIAHVRAKNISPLQMWRVVKFGVRYDFWCGNGDGWLIAHQCRTPGRKIFRPYKCGTLLNLAGAINGRGDECQWDIDGVGAIGNYFARHGLDGFNGKTDHE